MTTIAYRNGILVADTGLTDGNTCWSGIAKKIYETPIGVLAHAGDADPQPLIEYIVSYERLPSKKEIMEADQLGDSDFLFIDKGHEIKHLWRCDDRKGNASDAGNIQIYSEYFAMGADKELAIGALAAGATAEHAVNIAARHGRHTKTPLWVYDTNEWRYTKTTAR